MLEELKKEVLEANLQLVKNNLVLYTWGNASQRDSKTGYIAIKPSGVEYDVMTIDDIVIVDINCNIIEGRLKPSSDTPTHIEIYKKHQDVNGIVHTHSTFATAFAQAGKEIPCYGSTHADYFYGSIPTTESLTLEDMKEYEKNTGVVINKVFEKRNILDTPGCLVKNHGVFTFGKDAKDAVYNATILEQVAKLAYLSEQLGLKEPVSDYLVEKHYKRKHGKDAYYGQK